MAINFSKGKGKGKKTTQAKTGSFLKTGSAAQEAIELEQKKIADKAKEVRRFWMKPDHDVRITFLSGEFIDDMLDAPMWYEHQIFKDGHWRNWPICVSESEPCPLCNAGFEARLVAGFTIINHDSFKLKNGTVIKDQLQLLVCKQATFKLLQKLAAKKGGLVGATFEVSRSSNNVANVGDMFDFEGKSTLKELQAEYGSDDKIIKPFDFNDILIYRDAETLVKEGFVVGQAADDTSDYSGKL